MSHATLTVNGRNAAFVAALIANEVKFLVVGGLAVVFYGCRDKFKVEDLDLMLCAKEDNMERFLKALAALNLHAPWSAKALARPNAQVPIKDDFYLDILTPPKEFEFESLLSASLPASVNGHAVSIVGRSHLIALKRLAVKSAIEASEKHRTDLACLVGT